MIFDINDEFKESFIVSKKIHQDFIQLSQDRNPLHTNDDFALSKGFKKIVMHGNIFKCISILLYW